jgi:tRNA(Leu) C34 or U34 (ribose-2'-O)-methylase TrmL
VFGAETKGLPENLLTANKEGCISIPMHGTRSLNLATVVGIVLFEAVRQQQHDQKHRNAVANLGVKLAKGITR